MTINKHRIVGLMVLIAIAVIAIQFFLSYQKTNHPLRPYRSPPIAPLQEKLTSPENAPQIQSVETLMDKHYDDPLEVAPATPAWMVQIASLTNEISAQTLLKKLKELGYDAFILTSSQGKSAFRVCVGPFTDRAVAITSLGDIQESLKMTGILKQYTIGDT